jgi:hypothetical protein
MAGTKFLGKRQKGLKKPLLISRIQRGTAGFKGRRFRFFDSVESQPFRMSASTLGRVQVL